MRPARSTTVVIGIGNVIHSDDGLGVHAVRRLRHRTLGADDIQLIEGGTAGLMLLPHLAAARRAIIIDAIVSRLKRGWRADGSKREATARRACRRCP